MSVILNFQGAAGTVTGSKFILEHEGARLLVDAGLYQGERSWRRLNWEHTIDRPEEIDDVVLTHAHLDHCGYLPALVRQGFHGPVWTSAGTAGLLPIVLRDSAHLLQEEAAYAQSAGYSKHTPPLPLYTNADVERVLELVRSVPFGTPQATAAGATVTLHRAGHVLGSASVLVSVGGRSVLFSGDLGRPRHPLSSHAQTRHPLMRWCWNRRTATASTRSWPGWMSTSHWPRPSVGPLVGAGRC
jgi:Cft2 family RNA processing exonuclease